MECGSRLVGIAPAKAPSQMLAPPTWTSQTIDQPQNECSQGSGHRCQQPLPPPDARRFCILAISRRSHRDTGDGCRIDLSRSALAETGNELGALDR